MKIEIEFFNVYGNAVVQSGAKLDSYEQALAMIKDDKLKSMLKREIDDITYTGIKGMAVTIYYKESTNEVAFYKNTTLERAPNVVFNLEIKFLGKPMVFIRSYAGDINAQTLIESKEWLNTTLDAWCKGELV